jgi:phosphoserine phosphatase RsbU/P
LSSTLQSVNRLFYEATEPNKNATLFLGVYDDTTRRLRYANCGHNPPVLLRADRVELLTSTATVLGLFETWECDIAEICLHPGDTPAICTDGVLEAANQMEKSLERRTWSRPCGPIRNWRQAPC